MSASVLFCLCADLFWVLCFNCPCLHHSHISASFLGQDAKSEKTNQRSENPLPLFCSEPVQSLLHRITGFDITKINRVRPAASVPPEYELLTDEQLKQVKVMVPLTILKSWTDVF